MGEVMGEVKIDMRVSKYTNTLLTVLMSASRSQRNKIKSFDTVLVLRQVTELTLPRKRHELLRDNCLCFYLPCRESLSCGV